MLRSEAPRTRVATEYNADKVRVSSELKQGCSDAFTEAKCRLIVESNHERPFEDSREALLAILYFGALNCLKDSSTHANTTVSCGH